MEEPPQLTRQNGFNYYIELVYDQVVNEIQDEIIYKSVPSLTKSKSEDYDKNCIKVIRSYSY
jgi:hypothetical protein